MKASEVKPLTQREVNRAKNAHGLKTVQFQIAMDTGKFTIAGYGNDRWAVHPDIRWNGYWTVTHIESGMSVIPRVAASWTLAIRSLFRVAGIQGNPDTDATVRELVEDAIGVELKREPDGLPGLLYLGSKPAKKAERAA